VLDTATQTEIILSDLSVCQPAAALAREKRPGCWHLVDYETDDGLKGVMLYARPEVNAPEISLPLPDGLFKIHLGINYAKSEYGDRLHNLPWSAYGNVEVKLSGDVGFHRAGAEQMWAVDVETESHATRFPKGKRRFRTLQDTYWRTARLAGQALVIRPPIYPYDCPDVAGVANLSYVRLVPLTAAEAAAQPAWQPTEATRCLAQVWCAGMLSGHIQGTADHHPTSVDWFRHEIAPSVNSDIGVIIFEAIRGNYCCFRTRIGDVGTPDNHWPEEWVDPLAAFTQVAHENHLKLFASLRMIGGVYPTIDMPIGWARHFWAHQEWAKLDRDGRPTTNLSLAFPEVRDYWLSLLREALEYGVDGLVLYFHRFHPFVAFEAPVVASFQAQHGLDPRQLPPDDPRWITHSAGYVTEFVRQARRLVNEYPGRTLGVTFWAAPTGYDPTREYDPIRYSCDVKTWIKEGLAEYYFPMSAVNFELVRALRALGGPAIHIWPDLMPRTQPGELFVPLARAYYAAGADGFCMNDGERRTPRLSEWAVERSLGHRDLLDDLERAAADYYRVVNLKYLMGYNTRFSFNNFGGDP
jgi:hypothetical protein